MNGRGDCELRISYYYTLSLGAILGTICLSLLQITATTQLNKV